MAEGGRGNDYPLILDHTTEETTEKGSDFLTHESSNENPTVGMALKDGVLSFLEDLDKAKDFLSCINCQQEFDNSRQSPLLLPCLTAICKKCVLVLLASQNTSIECPYCKCSHACAENGSITLPRDTIREGVLGIYHVMKGESDLRCEMCTGAQRASHRCFDCSLFICDECTKLHSSLRTLMNHSYVEIRSLLTRDMDSLKLFSPTLYCSIPGHEQKILEIFCSSESCQRLICLLCAVNAHKTHDLCDISQVLSEKNKALRELKISLKTRNENLFKSLKELEEKKNASYTESVQLEKEIKLCFSKAKLVLEKREKELCDVLKRKQNERDAAFELEKCRLSNTVDSRLQACHYVDASNALHCPPSFINISKYVELRLKSLESEPPRGNSRSFEKIQFIDKELDLLIDGAKIGEIVTTKASYSKTEAYASPSTCAVGSEITFTVKLKTSSGELIKDESVQVCICCNGKPFKAISCFYGKTSSYIGNWVPEKAMKSTWYILSNGIGLDLPRDGTLHVIDNCIIEKDVSKPDSVKVFPEKMPKQRRNRRFVSNETESDMSLSTVSSETFKVKVTDKFIVKVYQGSITKLRVDCIVNAANDQLMHGGGVALAIAEAAGYEFDRESAEYIRQNGPIPVGKCCVTSPGKLPYRCVIHTVGPRWHDYKNDEKIHCFDDLQEAVEVTFREAERLKMTSIAIPAISSGIFGVPRNKCVECYYQAVVAFLSFNKPTYLGEIHFVDRDPTMVEQIKAVFSQLRKHSPKKEDTPSPSYSIHSQQKQENLDVPRSSSIYIPFSNKGEECVIFQIPNSFSIFPFTGNLVNTEAEAVVCPQDKKCSSKEKVARALIESITDNAAYPPKIEKECRIGDVFIMECKTNSARWKYILHIVEPRWDMDSARHNQQYMKSLEKTYRNILKAAEREQISSIAMPILGAGVGGDYETPLETCSKIFATTVKSFSDENDFLSIKEIKLVFQSRSERFAYTDALKKVFDNDNFEVINLLEGQTHIEQSSSAAKDFCCMCMDTPSNPKALKCGHVFCKDCIDQRFKYKPACPSCSRVFGKMTGDQPPGTVSLRKERRWLPGYEDCNMCIVITYSIRGGLQGEEHPNPNHYFKGITRSGYLPNNTKGRQVAKLLNIAFSRKLVFTICRSRTTGEEGVVTWNDIHHKTRPEGGPQRSGYPDDTYLDRVLEELAVKGVTPESADDPEEYREYSRCFY